MDGCTGVISKTSWRWCPTHSTRFADIGDREYVNQFGRHAVSVGTPLLPEVVMRIGWLYERMLPWDFVELLRVIAAACPAQAGALLTPVGFARVFLAHAIKWPPLVRKWLLDTADSKTAADFVEAYVGLLRAANGVPYHAMHDGMSSKRMHCTTGIVMHGKQLGLLLPADPETSPCAAQGTVVTLGKGLTAYVLRADHGTAVAIVEELMQKVEKAQLHWPAGSGSVGLISFADGLMSLVREICSCPTGAEF